jgi:hypothetical protein
LDKIYQGKQQTALYHLSLTPVLRPLPAWKLSDNFQTASGYNYRRNTFAAA